MAERWDTCCIPSTGYGCDGYWFWCTVWLGKHLAAARKESKP